MRTRVRLFLPLFCPRVKVRSPFLNSNLKITYRSFFPSVSNAHFLFTQDSASCTNVSPCTSSLFPTLTQIRCDSQFVRMPSGTKERVDTSLASTLGSAVSVDKLIDRNLHHISQSPFQPSQIASKSAESTDLLQEVEEQFDAAAMNYDNSFSEVFQVMDECNTLFEYAVAERRARTVKLMDQLKVARESAQLAEEEAADNRVVNTLLERLDALEEKKHRVLVSIEDTEATIARLQNESRVCKETVSALGQRNTQLQDKWSEAQPTLKFIRRLLRAVSNAALQPQTDPNVIQGFIGSDDGKTVVPFKVKANNPTFDEIKAVWDIIAAQDDSEPPPSSPTH